MIYYFFEIVAVGMLFASPTRLLDVLDAELLIAGSACFLGLSILHILLQALLMMVMTRAGRSRHVVHLSFQPHLQLLILPCSLFFLDLPPASQWWALLVELRQHRFTTVSAAFASLAIVVVANPRVCVW